MSKNKLSQLFSVTKGRKDKHNISIKSKYSMLQKVSFFSSKRHKK